MSDIALEILDLAFVPGSNPPVYAVGMAASRITMADQQQRAINIVWALLQEKRIRAGEKVAVIGAGIAGVTSAAYAINNGLKVAIFEKHQEPFALQQGSGRWVHPNIYEWPANGWSEDTTTFACMNWSAGAARDIVATLRKEWKKLIESPELEWYPKTEISDFTSSASGATVVALGAELYGPYSCVIMAAGFGEETELPDLAGKPYWRDDDLHQRLQSGGGAVVSGCGDGGLVDAIRIALRGDFRHDMLATIASDASSYPDFIERLLRIERDTSKFPDGKALTKAMLDLNSPPSVTEKLRAQLRPNTKVTLNSGRDGPFTRASCLLNRFLVAELCKLDAVDFQRGKVELPRITRSGAQFKVPIAHDDVTCNKQVDVVVVRHGPQRNPLTDFPSLERALKPARAFLRTYRAGVDRTRSRASRPLPMTPAVREIDLPPPSSDVLKFLAGKIQNCIKDELAERCIQSAEVKCTVRGQSVGVRISAPDFKEQLHVDFESDARVIFRFPKSGKTTDIALDTSIMSDSGAAVPILEKELPSVLRNVLEEYK